MKTENPRLERLLRERTRPGKRVMGQTYRNVRDFVRKNLSLLEDYKAELSWNEMAEVLAKEGLCWKTGNPVSGKDLRTIVSDLRRVREESGSKVVGYKAKKSSLNIGQNVEPGKSEEQAEKPENQKKLSIIEEMKRSAAERGVKPGK